MGEDFCDGHGSRDDLLIYMPEVVKNSRLVERTDQDIFLVQNGEMAESRPFHLIRKIAKLVGQLGGFHVLARDAYRIRGWRIAQIGQDAFNLLQERG